MRSVGFYWGVLGVIGIIASAVFRLTPRILELGAHSLGPWHWLALAVFTPYMAYAEGYKGFHLNFAPRVVKRALVLESTPGIGFATRLFLTLLAPLYCMGFFYATRARLLTSILVTSAIVLLVIAVSHTSQPWRGIVDAGVVTGLALGILSLLWHWLRFEVSGRQPEVAADLPERARQAG